MYDCDERPRPERAKIVQAIKDNGIKIVHTCCCCHKRIETYWNKYNELNGHWMAMNTTPSEIFNYWVAEPQRVLCGWCFGTGEWKKRGIKWK